MAIDRLAEKILYERKRNGLSQEALAQQLGLRRQSVSRWESGEGYPELETLLEISRCLGVSTDYLLSDSLPVGYEKHPGTTPVAHSPEARDVVATTKWVMVAGGAAALLGIAGVGVLWVWSVLDPAPVMGPELGLFASYWHYLDYNNLAPLFWAAAALFLLGCALAVWGAARRRVGNKRYTEAPPTVVLREEETEKEGE